MSPRSTLSSNLNVCAQTTVTFSDCFPFAEEIFPRRAVDGYSFNKSQQRTNFNERLPEQWVLHSCSWIRGPLHMSALALSAYSKAPKARTTEPTTGVATATPSAISIQYQWATEELEQGKARWKVCESESGLKGRKKRGTGKEENPLRYAPCW